MKILTSLSRAVEKRIAQLLGMICLVLSVSAGAASSNTEWRKLMQAGKWSEVVIALRYELKQGPMREELVEALARALVFDHRREEALALLSTAESREPQKTKKDRWRMRVRVVSGLFEKDETFQIFQRGLNLWAVGDLEGARRKLDEAWSREPDNGGILIRQGQLAVLMQKPELAVEKLRASRVYNPFEPEAELWLADAQEAAHDLDGARRGLAEYQKHLQRKKPSARSLLLEFRLRFDENPQESLRWLEGRARGSSDPWVAVALGLTWLEARPKDVPDRGMSARVEQLLRRPAVPRSFGFGENFSVAELPSEARIQEWRLRLEGVAKERVGE